MVISLNYINYPRRGRADCHDHLCRPDLHGMALLLIAEGASKPTWWHRQIVEDRLDKEKRSFKDDSWREPMAWLLGLGECPSTDDLTNWVVGNVKVPQKSESSASNSLATDSAVVGLLPVGTSGSGNHSGSSGGD
jgi:hypothetical protein